MDFSTAFNIVLVEPRIPQNTGSIARLCGATDTILHLVRPFGFTIDDKHLKRAGLDYWEFVRIHYWDSLDDFLDHTAEDRRFFFTTKTKRLYTGCVFTPGDFLVFGPETRGLPEALLDWYAPQCATLPMSNPNIRSLNLAMSAAIVLYEALRQQHLPA